MAKDGLYEYVALLHPTEDEAAAGKRTELLVDLKKVLASSKDEVKVLAARDIPADKLNLLDRIQFLIRPFAYESKIHTLADLYGAGQNVAAGR